MGRICLNIEKRFIDEPLTTEVLRQLDFTPCAEEKLKELLNNPLPERTIATIDIRTVKQFLVNLPGKWQHYTPTVRNSLLKLIIEKVELRHDAKTIDATLCWKTGFRQRVIIQRARATDNHGSNRTEEENRLLETLWRNAPLTAVREAVPRRTLSAIRNHARRLGLKRQRKTNSARIRRRWTRQEEAQAQELYESGTPFSEIAIKLNRTQAAVMQRAAAKKWQRPSGAGSKKKPVVWKTADQDFKGFQEAPSHILSPS